MFWITGAHGMLGGAVARLLADRGQPYLASDAEVDITDVRALEAFARPHRIATIINCAAFTNVRACETQEALATRVNGDAVGNLAMVAAAKDALLVHVSTDYVFDGAAAAPYREDAPANPINAYGRSKLAGERRLREAPCPWSLVRTAWLYGARGANFVLTALRILAQRGEMKVVTDQRGTPCYAADLAGALLAVAAAPPGIYHFANAGIASWYDLAAAAARLGQEIGILAETARVLPTTTAELGDPVTRPAYSALATDRIAAVMGRPPRPWQDALADFMDGLRGSARPWEPRP
ncbi:MAG TPA: dTDP-4-dehydrorhamnose reductase [Planctomycetes bacterium]|nr:dTDP-4-dehydrorhamnose reductase [Planctomycetota bacterium]